MKRVGVAVLFTIVVLIAVFYAASWVPTWVPTGFANFPFYGQNPQHTGFLDVGDMPVLPYSKWNYTPAAAPLYSGFAYYDGVLYFPEYDKNITALYANNGSVVWGRQIGGGFGVPAIWNGRVYAPTSLGNTVRLYALNATSGSTLWYHGMPAGDDLGSPVIEDGIVVAAVWANGDGIYAYNATDGTPIWNYSITGGVSTGSQYPAIWSGMVYATSRKDGWGAGSYRVHAINLTTGEFIWNYTVNAEATPVTVAYERAYFGVEFPGSRVFAMNASTGIQLWNTSLGAGTRSSPSVYNGVLYIGDESDGVGTPRFHVIDAYNGTELWNITLSVETWSGTRYSKPLITNESLAFLGGEGGAYGINLTSRSKMWRYYPGDDFYSFTAARFERGMLYLSGSSKIYALQAAPDLRVTALSYVPPSGNSVGDNVQVTATINNNGNPTSGSFNVSFYINDSLQETNTVAQMGQNGTINTTFTWQATYGSSTIKVFADSGDDEEEYNETNNNATTSISVSRKVLPISPANGTIVDRNGVNDSYDDYTILMANLSDGSTGTSVTFYANRTEPSQYASTGINLGTNDTVNGIATFKYEPITLGNGVDIDRAGRYEWWATASNSISEGSRYFDLYGGLNVTFRYNDSFPNSSYESGDNVTVDVLLEALSPETFDDLINVYGAAISVTLTPPTGAPITFDLNNTSSTTTTTLGSGTVYSSMIGLSYYIDFTEDLVPDPVEEACWAGGLSGKYVKWTCDEGTCPGESGQSYEIEDSGDVDSECGSWSEPMLDWFYLPNYGGGNGNGPIASGFTPLGGGDPTGWTFDVEGQQTTYFWGGSYLLQTESGSWSSSASASANYFFSGSGSRGFTVPGAAAAAAPSGGPGVGRAVDIDAESVLIVTEAGVNKLTLDRGTSEPITILIKNVGDFVLTDIIIEASGLPYGWVVVTPSKIESLGQNEVVEVKAYLFIPETAGLGEYDLVFKAHSFYVESVYAAKITVTDECEPCPAPSAWSECIEEEQSRTNYRCGAQTDYACEEWTQTKDCAPLPEEVVNNMPLLVAIAAIGAVVVVIGRFYRKK